jgi:phosphatidylinositol glycan class M
VRTAARADVCQFLFFLTLAARAAPSTDTDVDYDVFSDGAELVWNGRSPFERPTYRYTPLLALLLTPNVWAHRSWGKLLFAAADLAVGAQVHAILLARRVPHATARACASAWLFNPLSLNVSTRGNAESIVAVLLLGAVFALMHKRPARCGALLACAMHMKPYPVIYVPAFLVALDTDAADGAAAGDGSGTKATNADAGADAGSPAVAAAMRAGEGAAAAAAAARPPHPPHPPHPPAAALLRTAVAVVLPSTPREHAAWRARLAFALALVLAYAALFALCWAWCGVPFWREALVYHVARQDTRHNFSPYHYALYLSPPASRARALLASLAFVPQATLLLALAWRFGRDLPFCMLLQTVVFVAFNKVVTAQYFVWYLALLPLALPSSTALCAHERRRASLVGGAWLATLLCWLGVAHQLEFRARNVLTPLWLASLAFFGANVVVVREAIRMHTPTPLFRAGRLARQACLYGAEAPKQGHAPAVGADGVVAIDERARGSGSLRRRRSSQSPPRRR